MTRAEIVKWVAESMRPFSIVEDGGFQCLMKTGRPTYHIPSAATVARDVKEVFKRTKERIAAFLQDYEGDLSFATDGWTSTNHKAYVAVTVHLIKDNVPISFLLDIVEVAKSHSGVNLARAFANILKDYGINHKVSCTDETHGVFGLLIYQILSITCDNASNNDTMTVRLARLLPRFRGDKSRVRCFLHIVNLVAKVIIRQFDGSKRAGDAEDALAELENDLESEDEGEESDDDIPELDEMDEDIDVAESIQPVQSVLNKVRCPCLYAYISHPSRLR